MLPQLGQTLYTLARSRETPRGRRIKFILIALQNKLFGLASVPSDGPRHGNTLTYRGSRHRAARAGGIILLGIRGSFLWPPSHKNSEMLLPCILILPDLKRAALTLRRPFHRIRPVDFGSHPVAPRWRLWVAPLFCGAAPLRSGLRGVRGTPFQPDARVPHQPVPLRAREPEVEVTTEPRSAWWRLLQLEDKTPLPGTSRSIWNVLKGPAPGLRCRRAALAIGPERHQLHLAHVGAGGPVLDPEPAALGPPSGRKFGLLVAFRGGRAPRSTAASAIDLGACTPGVPGKGVVRGLGPWGIPAAALGYRSGIAVQALGQPARIRGAIGRFALQRDLHGRAPGGPRVHRTQELRDEHGRAALERAHGLLQAAAVLCSTVGEGVRAAPPWQGVECHEKVVFSLLV